MESRSRFAVSADELDVVRIDATEQVEEQAEPHLPEASQWNGPMPHTYGDGATHADADGD